jgi:hemerythrin-like domain-containing protein
MPSTANLRRQHDAAMTLASQIIDLMDRCESRNDAYRISLALAKLLGLLRIHLAQEDQGLYPAMIRSGDADAAATAQAFATEMGGLAEQLERFAARWTCSAAIFAALAEFRAEAMAVFAALATRIHRENEELYPLAQRVVAARMHQDAA